MEKIGTLADKIKEGDQKAFHKLFDLLWESLFIYAKSILMDEDQSKDSVQEVFIDYWNRREKIENKNIEAFLRTAVRFNVYKKLKKQPLNRTQLDAIDGLSTTETIEFIHDFEDTRFEINNIMSKLSPRNREILVLSKIKGLSNDLIAEKLNISKRTVENQLSTSLKFLKKKLHKASLTVWFL